MLRDTLFVPKLAVALTIPFGAKYEPRRIANILLYSFEEAGMGNWHRDLLKTILFSAGVVIAVTAFPGLVVGVLAAARSFIRDPLTMLGLDWWMLFLGAGVQAVAGWVLFRKASDIAQGVFPS